MGILLRPSWLGFDTFDVGIYTVGARLVLLSSSLSMVVMILVSQTNEQEQLEEDVAFIRRIWQFVHAVVTFRFRGREVALLEPGGMAGS